MEHIKITKLADGYVRLSPKRGWKLYAISLDRTVSEAVVKEENAKNFKAVKK